MQLMRKPLRWISVVLCLCLLLAGCAPAAEESSSQAASSTPASSETSESAAASSEAQTASAGKADKTTLVYGLNTEPGKLDPQNNSVLSGMVVAKQIYEPLIDKDPETGEFVPRLATEWEWVDDTHLRMKLREDVTFHDGTPFTAEDVKFTIGRFPDGAATGSLFSAFDPENTVVEDDYTITIAFKFACAPALNFLTNGRAYIVSKAYVEANGEESLNQSGMGTGPYAFKEWVIGSHLMLTRYNDYWGGAPAIENLTVRFIVEDSARMVALETGEIDIGSELQAVDIERIMNGEVPGVVGYTSPSYKVWYLAFNENFEPFQKREVRLAIAHAVDWESACEAAGGSAILPADSALAKTVFGYESQGLYEYDPELSKQLLAEAGYPDGFEVTYISSQVPVDIRMTEIVQEYLAQVGIVMTVESVDSATWLGAQQNGTANFTTGNMTANTGDPVHTLSNVQKDSPYISLRKQDEKFNELYEAGLRELDEEKRLAIYSELQKYIFDEALQVPMYEQIITYGVRDYVQGFIPDPGVQLDFRLMSIA